MALFSMKSEPETKNQNVEILEPQGFQLYFAGALNPVFEEDLKNKGANRLASQLLDKNAIKGWIEGRDEGRCKGRLFIDSGAYTAHTQGTELDVDAYIEYLNSIDDYTHCYAQVDHIPGRLNQPKTRQELEEAPEISWKNYLYMRPKMKSPDKLLPIFHQGEPYKWLHNMLDWTDENGNHIPYIGISPANDQVTSQKINFIEKCFQIISKSSNPDVMTHAFGMTSLKVLESYPFTSADSTSWLMNGANGSIMTPFGSVLVSDGSLHLPAHINRMPKAAQEWVIKYVTDHGFTMEDVKSDYKARIKVNIQYLLEWAKNYQYKPSSVKRKLLF